MASKLKYTTEEFILQAKRIHGDRYDYTKTVYKGAKKNIDIRCLIHGVFSQEAYSHKIGGNCPKCAGAYSPTTEEFIEECKMVHGDKYGYSHAEYAGKDKNIIIECFIHGFYKQRAGKHKKGDGCKRCATEAQRTSLEEYLAKVSEKLKEKYKYIELKHKVMGKTEILTSCNTHRLFWQRADGPLSGKGCKQCSDEERRNSLEYFIEKSKKIHGNEYDYSKTKYKTAREEVEIVCRTHKSFFQVANAHMQGHGCPKCKISKGEKSVRKYLKVNKIKFNEQVKIEGARFSNTNAHMIFDFYLPDYNLVIEYDGRQHFVPIKNWGGKEGLAGLQRKDREKDDYCLTNNIKMLRIPYIEFDNIEKILKRELGLK